MISVTPQMIIRVACAPVDFRWGIDRLCQTCRSVLAENPLPGAVFVFRNRKGTSIKVLVYDGQGYWLCQKRFSAGHKTTHGANGAGRFTHEKLTKLDVLTLQARYLEVVGRPTGSNNNASLI